MMLAMSAALMGTVLGLRFKVFALVPAVLIGLTASILIGIAHHDGLWATVEVAAVTISALQAGYLGGTAIRWQKSTVKSLPSAQKRQPRTQRA
jgi:hypothetical protein